MAKISQILENFAKIANKFLGHFMETAWIVGPLIACPSGPAIQIVSVKLSQDRIHIVFVKFCP